jgi:hypothetical protein
MQASEGTDPAVVQSLYLVASSLSLLGSGTIILSYILVKELRNFPFSLVLNLSICDFFFSLKFFLLSFFLASMDENVIVSTDPLIHYYPHNQQF